MMKCMVIGELGEEIQERREVRMTLRVN